MSPLNNIQTKDFHLTVSPHIPLLQTPAWAPAWARPPESCLGKLMMFNFGRRSSEEEDLRAEQLLLKDKWRAIFDQFDPEGFGEIPWPELLTVVHTEEFRWGKYFFSLNIIKCENIFSSQCE